MADKATHSITFTPADLTDEQRDGVACVTCAADLGTVPSVPVGVVDGGQVFACTACVEPITGTPGAYPDGEPETVRSAEALTDRMVDTFRGIRRESGVLCERVAIELVRAVIRKDITEEEARGLVERMPSEWSAVGERLVELGAWKD